MRENMGLYKGKRQDNGEWEEGNLFHNHDGRVFVGELVVDDDLDARTASRYTLGIAFAEVIPETVGQYTGLADKNGKRIFEGDVVEISHDAYPGVKGEVFFKNGSFMLKNVGDVLTLYGFLPWCEVIGNRFDYPELLKEVEK